MSKEKNGPPLPRPLYKSAEGAKFSTEANAGLWYDKFVDRWEGNSWDQAKANKLAWIKTVAGPVGSKSHIEESATRQKQLADRCGGRAFVLTTESRFVTGLGREHPIENGFAWHHTLGTPYLSGSSIKGLIRNWAEQWEGQTKAEVNSILGGPGSVGRVLVLDALPTQQPSLEADVMTPHYSAYYQNGDAPGDWLSPTPIPFLVVAAGTPFQFALVPNTFADKPHLKTVEQWLRDALSWLGAGAKTAVGYGRFTEQAPIPTRPPSKIEDISYEQLKQGVAELPSSQVLLKLETSTSSGTASCQAYRVANTLQGFQVDGGWTLIEAPALPAGVLVVLAERPAPPSKRAKYLKVLGRLLQIQNSTNKGKPKNSQGPRR